MASESALCAEYLYNKLNVSTVTNALGTAARIFRNEVPQNPITGQTALFPCVVFHMQGSEDSFGAGAVRIFTRAIWTVKVGVEGEEKDAETIYAIVDSVLQNTSGTVSAGSVYSCYRTNEIPNIPEPKLGGGYYNWAGGMYRLECRATNTP